MGLTTVQRYCAACDIRVLATRFCVLNVFYLETNCLPSWSAVRNKLTFYLPPRRLDVVYIRCCANTTLFHFLFPHHRVTSAEILLMMLYSLAPCVLWIQKPKTAASVICIKLLLQGCYLHNPDDRCLCVWVCNGYTYTYESYSQSPDEAYIHRSLAFLVVYL